MGKARTSWGVTFAAFVVAAMLAARLTAVSRVVGFIVVSGSLPIFIPYDAVDPTQMVNSQAAP